MTRAYSLPDAGEISERLSHYAVALAYATRPAVVRDPVTAADMDYAEWFLRTFPERISICSRLANISR